MGGSLKRVPIFWGKLGDGFDDGSKDPKLSFPRKSQGVHCTPLLAGRVPRGPVDRVIRRS